MKVIDFFCGAGGFSEGFKQAGYEIICGYDNWKPAIDTFNHNFNLNCKTKNILDYNNSIEDIKKLPNTEIIIGSPPCVSFSSSNKSGNADKSLGLELTNSFLRIIAVKKHQPNSILRAWFMENVVNSKVYVKRPYSFIDLKLKDWAKENNIDPNNIALDLTDNTSIINSADYGSFQSRKRLISGEIINIGRISIPDRTHNEEGINGLKPYNTIKKIKKLFPQPYSEKSDRLIKDIQYELELPLKNITDHFYDTGIYKNEWVFSKHWKVNHPFMGKMSFPENENKPSRTITATRIANSRESIIYKSEVPRIGDGEYRLPTVREAAMIMGFPITYQFYGSEYTKWRLVGNAVCCSVSKSFAKEVIEILNDNQEKAIIINKDLMLDGIKNLNTYSLKEFNKPPIKNKNAKFRRQAIKEGNITVSLSNYNISKKGKVNGRWFTSVQYGTGKGFLIQEVEDGYYKEINKKILEIKNGKQFIDILGKELTEVANTKLFQEMYEKQMSIQGYTEPTELIDIIGEIINKLDVKLKTIKQDDIFIYKKTIPISQLFALYAVNKISSLINRI